MRRRTPASILVLCSATLLWGCPDDSEEVLGTLTVSASGALVTPSGRVLRAKESRQYTGHTLTLVRLDDQRRLERLSDRDGNVVRERRGEASDAQAQSQERSDGEDCSVFTDQSGEQVANSCAVPADTAQDQRCERLDAPGPDGEAMICTICYADDGHVVSRECHPVASGDPCADGSADCAPGCDPNNPNTDCMPPPTCQDSADPNCVPPPVDECRVTHEGEQTCRVCATADGQTFSECWLDPDPIRCEIVVTTDGLECVYCFDAAGEVVERSCQPPPCQPDASTCDATLACAADAECPQGLACLNGACCRVDSGCLPPPPLRCEEFITSDGMFCRVCYDQAGNAVERWCEQQPPSPVECREYREPNGRVCLICVDVAGNIVRRECSEPPCPMGDLNLTCGADLDCPPQSACVDGICIWDCGVPQCRLFQTANGYFCEICGDLNNDGIEDLSDAHCYPPPTDPLRCEETATSDGQRCVVCYDPAGTIVEQRCDDVPQPPRCVVQQGADATGQSAAACEICYDPAGHVVYNSCEQVQCWREEQIDASGAYVVCEVCATATGELSRYCHGTGCDPSDPATDCPPPPLACEQRVRDDGSVCVICYGENGQVVEERCEGGSEPIWCEDVQTSAGELCTLCRDGLGNVVSDSCAPAEQCWLESYVENGQQVTCEVCADAAGLTRRECFTTCSDAAGCPQTVTAYVDPVQCGGNPWEQNSASDPNADQAALVRVWLESLGVPVYNIRFERVYDATCDACSCPRGDRLYIETTAEGAERLRQFGFAVR